MTSKRVLKKLHAMGFINDHTTGSHIILYHSITKRRAVVPYHMNDIPKGTLSAILREAQIDRDEFIRS